VSLSNIATEKTSGGCVSIDFKISKQSGWEQWVLLSSDRHHDNAKADWSLEKKHLEQAKQRDALICDFGDLMCLMQGKWDRRSDTSQCRPEHREGRYIDSVIETAVDFFAPYAKHWAFVSPGNHETSILKHHETDPTARFVEGMQKAGANKLVMGDYAGFIRFRVQHGIRKSSNVILGYHHGYGGGGPVTKGVIQTNRMATYLPDCNIVVSGHVHEKWALQIDRSRLNHVGIPYLDRQVHIKIPGYKDEYSSFKGWHIERGGTPKPLGAWWLRFFLNSEEKLDFEFMEAT